MNEEYKNTDSNLVNHAINEFRAAGWIDADGLFADEIQSMICNNIIDLLKVFSSQGHSGTTAPYVLQHIYTLANFEPICPLTGEDSEWTEVMDGVFQNKRCGRVFKTKDRFDGQAYDIESVVFYRWKTDEETGEKYKGYFTDSDSAQPVEFPYTPKREYREWHGE